jgi:16S rRNA C1402 (ribose-2'-O) methylase RsmI
MFLPQIENIGRIHNLLWRRPTHLSRVIKITRRKRRGTTREVLTHFETAPRGEIVVVVGGKPIVKEAKEQILRPRRSITQTDMILIYYQIKTKSYNN